MGTYPGVGACLGYYGNSHLEKNAFLQRNHTKFCHCPHMTNSVVLTFPIDTFEPSLFLVNHATLKLEVYECLDRANKPANAHIQETHALTCTLYIYAQV